ncbi:regulatory protein [Mycobacterium tuberculosis]|nr:regulatory protein [Mycobacterium tuberculosis]
MAVKEMVRTGRGGAMRVLVPPHGTAGEPPPRTLPARPAAQPILWLVTVRSGAPGADPGAALARLAAGGARTVRLAGVAQLTGRPATIHSRGSVRRLLDGLSPLALEVLRIASVLSGDLEAGRLADLSGRPVAELVAPLQEVIDADLVRPTDPLTFRHDGIREAVRRTVPPDQRRALRRRAADLSLAQGAPLDQVALAMAETAEPGDPETAALLRRALRQAAPDTAATLARRSVALAPAGSAERAAAVADALPLLARVGRARESLELAATALGGPLPAPLEARIRQGAAISAMTHGSFADMLRHSRAGAALDGVPEAVRAHLTALRCLATLLTGDVRPAERLLAPAAETASRAGGDAALALLRTAASMISAFRLDFTAAQRLAAEAVQAAGRAPDASPQCFPAVWRASLHAMMGEVDEGLREASEGGTAARRPLVSGAAFGPPARLLDPADDPWVVRTALEASRRGEAAAAVAKAERRAALNPGVPFFTAVAAHARGLLDGDAASVERAVESLRGIARPLELASALEDAGRLLMESDRGAAAEHLAEAETVYAGAGAGHAAARVRRLRPAGRRRTKRRRAAQGWDALTPAEQRVASLVAEGASNRQAAERLFLSPATVGTHLMHAFRKLGVNSRVELARIHLERGAG